MMANLDLTLTLGLIAEDQMTEETTTTKLSSEMIEEIITRAPISCLFRSRYVSTSWHHLINHPRIPMLHYKNSLRNQNPTSLILQSGDSDLFSIPDFNTCEGGAIKLTKLPFKSWLPSFRIVGSVNGFICLADLTSSYRSVFVCNPVSGDSFLVPDAPVYGRIINRIVVFGYSPKHSQYKVLRWRPDNTQRTVTSEILTLGSHSWRTLETTTLTNRTFAVSNSCSRLRRPCYGVFLHGVLYYSNRHGQRSFYINTFSFDDETFGNISLPTSIRDSMDQGGFHLAALRGCLVVTGFSQTGLLHVWIMKNQGVTTCWDLEFSIQMTRHGRFAHPLGIQMNGNIVLEVDGTALYSYAPTTATLEQLQVPGLPKVFLSVPLVGTLATMEDAIACPVLQSSVIEETK